MTTSPPDLQLLQPPALNPVALLDAVEAWLRRFLALRSDHDYAAVTLWAAHAHMVHFGEISPRLAVLSPESQSGKSRVLELLQLLTPRSSVLVHPNPAPIFRSIASEQPTLLFDEIDGIFGRSASNDQATDLRTLLNAGHRRGASVSRCVGPNFEVQHFSVYAAVALAGLDRGLPETLLSRCVIVKMRRRAPEESIDGFRVRRHTAEGHELRDKLAEWAAEVAKAVGEAFPELPSGISDRPADVWEPLLAIAEAAGGHWPERARAACLALVNLAVNHEPTLGVRLLSDLRVIFGGADAMSTEVLLVELNDLDESPWGALQGKPLDARNLARLLKPYEVFPCNIKKNGKVLKGYRRDALADPWSRYLDPPQPAATPATPATNHCSIPTETDTAHAGNLASLQPSSDRTVQPKSSAGSGSSAALEVAGKAGGTSIPFVASSQSGRRAISSVRAKKPLLGAFRLEVTKRSQPRQ
jgi:hypothetical protein